MLYKGYKLLANLFGWVDDWLDTSRIAVPLVAIIIGVIMGIIPILNVVGAVFLFFLCFMAFSDCGKMADDIAGTGDFMHKYKRCFGFALLVMLYWTSYVAWMFYVFTLYPDNPPYTAILPIGIVLVSVVFIGYIVAACRLFHKRMKWEKSILPDTLK